MRCPGMLLCLAGQLLALRVLVLVIVPGRSHFLVAKAAADVLHERGHEITLVSAFGTGEKVYREIIISEMLPTKDEIIKGAFEMGKESKIATTINVNMWVARISAITFTNREFQALLNDKNENFDLVVSGYLVNEVLIGLGVKYDCPVVLISPVSLMSRLARYTGNPIESGTAPNVFLPYSSNMNLWQRTINAGLNLFQEIVGRWLMTPTQEGLYKKYLPEEAARVPFSSLPQKVAVVLINSHPATGVARPLLPSSVEVGGFHIGPPEPLPEDLQKLMDSAEHGVVYFSMGSILRSSQMPLEVRRGILAALSKINQTILWKFEEDLSGKPDNVIIRNWMPQTSILAHPNLKMFISHGGILSCTEAAHYGIPLLAIPVLGDQHHNAAAVAGRGDGIVLEYSNLTEASMEWGLREVLSNPKYGERAKRVSQLYHDRAIRPRDLVAFYCEHAVRSGGAAHLAPPRLSRCSELLLDVAAVVLVPLVMLLLLLILVLRACIRACGRVPKDKSKHKKN